MIGQTLRYGKPVLCLYKKGLKLSAMIAGCPEITKVQYGPVYERDILKFFLSLNFEIPIPLQIFLKDHPVQERVRSRNDFQKNSVWPMSALDKFFVSGYMSNCELVPANTMREVVRARLNQSDCKINGFVLDGYPPSVEDLQNLVNEGIAPDLIFSFVCDDQIAIEHQCS